MASYVTRIVFTVIIERALFTVNWVLLPVVMSVLQLLSPHLR